MEVKHIIETAENNIEMEVKHIIETAENNIEMEVKHIIETAENNIEMEVKHIIETAENNIEMEVKHIIETAENNIERKAAKHLEKEVKQITEKKSGENTENESENVTENAGKKIAEKVPGKIMETKAANILELEDKKTIRTTDSKIPHLEADEISETPAATISQMQACNTSKREVYRNCETTELCDSCNVKFTKRCYQEDHLPAEFPPYESTCEKCLNGNTTFDNLDKQPTHAAAKLHFSGNKQISLEETLNITSKINFLKVSKICFNLDISNINTTTSDISIYPSTSGIDTNTSACNININLSTCDSDSTSVYDADINLNAYDADINPNVYGVDIDPNAYDAYINQSTYDTDINPNAYNTDNRSTCDADINSSTIYTNINPSASNIVTEPHMFGICKTADGSKGSLQSSKNLKPNDRPCPNCHRCFKSVIDLLNHDTNCEETSNSKHSFEIQKETRSNYESYRRDTSNKNSSEEIGKSRQTHVNEHLHENVCVNCNKYFPLKSSLTNHILTCDKENIKKSKKLYSAQEPYKCSHCSKYCKNAKTLQNHQKHCRKNVMAKHDAILKNEEVLQPYICQACNKEFNSRGYLKWHRNHCKQRYSLQSAAHSQKSEKPIICETCNKRFRTESSLETHKSKCKKIFSIKSLFKLEQQIISENESYKYEVSKKEYTEKWVLSHPQHSDVNTLYHPPKTKTADGSKKHEEESSEKKPFKCTYPHCKKRFATESARTQHRSSHGSKWKCQNCFNSFDNPNDYDAHKPECSQKWKKTPPGTYKTTYFPNN